MLTFLKEMDAEQRALYPSLYSEVCNLPKKAIDLQCKRIIQLIIDINVLHFYRYNFECLGNKVLIQSVLKTKEAIINSRKECFEKFSQKELLQYPVFLDGRTKEKKLKKGAKAPKSE